MSEASRRVVARASYGSGMPNRCTRLVAWRVVAAGFVTVGHHALAAQTLPDQLGCPECRIEAEVVAEFGHRLDQGMIGSPFVGVYSLADGGFALSDVSAPGVLQFFGPDGAYRRSLDRDGRGPGEFMGIHDGFRFGSGYLIYDVTLGRLTWLDEDFEFLRSAPFSPHALRLAMLPDESGLLINGLAIAHAPVGHVLQVVRFDGSTVAAFGGDGRPIDLRANPFAHHRLIAVDQEGGLWTSPLTRYELVRFSSSGDTLSVLRRESRLFEPSPMSRIPMDVRDGPPTPQMAVLTIDGEGLLWVAFQVPDADWENAVLSRNPRSAPDQNGIWDTVIEVLDPVDARLLARTTVPWSVGTVEMSEASGQVLLRYVSEKETGFLGVTVVRLSLERSPDS